MSALPRKTGFVTEVNRRFMSPEEDPLDPTEAEMKAAPELFTKMLGNARFIWTDSTRLDPASGVALFDGYGYGHGNANSVDQIDPERVVGTGIDDPNGTFARGVFSKALPPEKKARLFQLWFEAQAGLD